MEQAAVRMIALETSHQRTEHHRQRNQRIRTGRAAEHHAVDLIIIMTHITAHGQRTHAVAEEKIRHIAEALLHPMDDLMDVPHEPNAAGIIKVSQIIAVTDALPMSAQIEDHHSVALFAEEIEHLLISFLVIAHAMHQMKDAAHLDLRQLQQAGLSSAVPAWVWMGLLFGPMAAFLALLLVRAAKLTHPLGKLLCLPAALLLVIRFVPGVLYQLSLFPLAAPLPFITGNLYSVIDALLLGLSVSALRQSTCPEPPEIRSVQPAVV